MDVAKAVEESKAGKVEYRTDRTAIVHLNIGKTSFDERAAARELRRRDRGDHPRQAVGRQGPLHPRRSPSPRRWARASRSTRPAPATSSRRAAAAQPPRSRRLRGHQRPGAADAAWIASRKPGAGGRVNREQKAAAIAEIADQIRRVRGGLRRRLPRDHRCRRPPSSAAKLRDADATLRVVKNTLTERAADEAGVEAAEGAARRARPR